MSFDGTWNKPVDENLAIADQVETNPRRFYESVHEAAPDGVKQLKWYDQGVGTSWYDRLVGGALGIRYETNIIEGYKFLAENYQDESLVWN